MRTVAVTGSSEKSWPKQPVECSPIGSAALVRFDPIFDRVSQAAFSIDHGSSVQVFRHTSVMAGVDSVFEATIRLLRRITHHQDQMSNEERKRVAANLAENHRRFDEETFGLRPELILDTSEEDADWIRNPSFWRLPADDRAENNSESGTDSPDRPG